MSNDLVISPELVNLETVIEAGFDAGMKAWGALKTINEKRLYRERGYTTFDSYLRDEWDVQRSYGYKMIQACKAQEKLESSVAGDPMLPTINSERKLREFVTVPDNKVKAVFESAAVAASDAGSSEIKASHIREAKVKHGVGPTPQLPAQKACTPVGNTPLSTADPVVAGAKRRAVDYLDKLDFQLGNLGLSGTLLSHITAIRKQVEAIQ